MRQQLQPVTNALIRSPKPRKSAGRIFVDVVIGLLCAAAFVAFFLACFLREGY